MEYSVQQIKKMVSKKHRAYITEDFVTDLNHLSTDPELARVYKENFLTYINVMQDGKWSIPEYIHAVKFVSLKLMGYDNTKAYSIVFPERAEKLTKNGQQIGAFSCMYAKSKLVVAIFKQSIIPSYVLNAPLYQDALNELAKMIKDPAIKGMTKVKACEAILNATKQPDVVEGNINISVESSNTISDLRDITEQLAETFRNAVSNKTASLSSVTNTNIIDVTPTEKEVDEDE